MSQTIPIPAGAVSVTIADILFNFNTPPVDPNLPPVLPIGNNTIIQLPVNSVTIDGTGTDPEGGPLTYAWSQLSGPKTTLSNVTKPILTASNLTEGVCVFSLTATDQNGASTTMTTLVTIKDAIIVVPPPGTWKEMYRNSFETVADLDPFGNEQITNGTIVPAPGRTGNCFKAWVKKGQSNTHSGWRDEWQGPGKFTPDNTEIIKAYDMLVQSLPKSTGLLEQDHGNFEGTSGMRSLWSEGGVFKAQRNISGSSGPNIFGPGKKTIPLNQWMHIEIRSKYSTGNDGYNRVYIDDMVNAFYDSGLTKTTDGKSQYPKLGINWFTSPEADVIVLYDNLVISHKVS